MVPNSSADDVIDRFRAEHVWHPERMYRLHPPAEPLRSYIENYWFVSHAPGKDIRLRVEVFVDARADLIFNFGTPYRREVIGGGGSEHHRSNLDAQRLVPIRIRQHGSVRIVGVRFHLGGLAPFIRGSLAPWSGRTPSPELVFGDGSRELESGGKLRPPISAARRVALPICRQIPAGNRLNTSQNVSIM